MTAAADSTVKVWPDGSVCLASAEAAVLELVAGIEPQAAVVTPRFGEPVTLAVADRSFSWPLLSAPNSARVDWLADPGDDEPAFTCRVEVVSRHYFPLDALRGYGDGRDDFGSLGDDVLRAARQAATEVFEEASGRSFVPRIGRTKDYGRDTFLVTAHHDVQEVLSSGYRQASDSQLARTQGCGPFPRWAEYVYGRDSIPAEVSRAVLDLAAYTLRPSNRPIGATGESTDAGYIHFTTAGRDGATAIPEVNAAIEMFGAGRRMLW